MSKLEKILMSCVGCTCILFFCILSASIAFVALYLWIPTSEESKVSETQIIESMVEDVLAEALGKKIIAYKEEMEAEGTGGVFLPTYDLILCSSEYACIHEVGHWLDKNLDYPSSTKEFRGAMKDFLAQCEEIEDSRSDDYYCNLRRFPGLNGNVLGEGMWGGYSEAYAEMYEYNILFNHPLPQIFVEFYK